MLDFEATLRERVATFPEEDRPGCGYWHLHMPCSNAFIDASLQPTRLRRACVAAVLRAAEHLRAIKPPEVEARVVVCLTWPTLWDAQIIVFFGEDYYGRFFDRNEPEQTWTRLEQSWLTPTLRLPVPDGCTERVYRETMRDGDEVWESTLIYLGDLAG